MASPIKDFPDLALTAPIARTDVFEAPPHSLLKVGKKEGEKTLL